MIGRGESFQGCTANKNDVVWGSRGSVPYRGLGAVVMGGDSQGRDRVGYGFCARDS